jgi:TonB-dependent SusC/RagA subfamily outer membrane receptor
MQLKYVSAVIALLFFLEANAKDEPLIAASSLKSVTVYRSGAELTHNASVQLEKGNRELVIQGISNNIDINSVQINCPAAVTIMGIEFAKDYLLVPEVTFRIKLLQDSVEQVQKEIEKVNVQIQTTTELLEVLKLNSDIKGLQTGLSVAELMKLMDYYKNKSTELQNDLVQQRQRQKKLSELISKIRAQLKEEQSKNTKTAGQLKLQLSVASTGKYDFVIFYITPNASWTPYYDIRVDDIKSPLKVIYKAKVAQTTGMDWKKVKLSLSTSVPIQRGNAPVLKPWFLSYINPVYVMDKTLSSVPMALRGRAAGVNVNDQQYLKEAFGPGNVKIRGTSSINEAKPLYVVNGAEMSEDDFSKLNANAIKSVDVLKDAQATTLYGSRAANGAVIVTLKDGLDEYVSVTDNELNVTFDIDLPYDVPANGKEQTATLKQYAVNALYKYYSVPKLDKDAFLLADVSEWENLNLLPGDANIIFEGTYIGKSFIDPTSTSDTLNLTIGRDKRVVIKKEKLVVYSSTKFLASNKAQKFSYELTVKNNKKDTVLLTLKDQYPLTTNKEIEVELVDDGGASVNSEIGLLTWKLELAPGQMKKLRFSYRVKYPKDKSLNLN